MKSMHASNCLDVQKGLILLDPDPVFPGLVKGGRGSVFINRLDADFALTNLLLKIRIGVFASMIGAGVGLNILSNRLNRATFIYGCTGGTLVALAAAVPLGTRGLGHKLPKKAEGILGGIFVCLVIGWIVLAIAAAVVKEKFGNENFAKKYISRAIELANDAACGFSPEFPRDVQNIQNMWMPEELKNIGRFPTIAELWREHGHIPKVDNLKRSLTESIGVGCLTHGTCASFVDSTTDEWVGQMLCLSYLCQWGEVYDPKDWAYLPGITAFLSDFSDVVYFDMRTSDYRIHDPKDKEFWEITRSIIHLNQSYMPCVAFVRVGATPVDCSLVGVLIGDDNFMTHTMCANSAWMRCKANVIMQTFMLIEVFHMAIHKVSALQAIAQQRNIPVDHEMYRILEPFSIMASFAMAELETLLVAPENNPLLVFGFFVKDMDGLKRIMSQTVGHLMRSDRASPCNDKWAWWGTFQQHRRSIFTNTTKKMMSKVTDEDMVMNWSKEWVVLCNAGDENAAHSPSVTTERILSTLHVISVQHADATFVGGRLGLSPLQILAMGMMQKGMSNSPQNWTDSKWQDSLPTFGLDDFTMWWVSAQTTAYGTSQSSGPYLMDQDIYSPGTSAEVLSIAKVGFSSMVELGKTSQLVLAKCSFQPSWFYPPSDAAKDFATMTSGTYL